MKRILVALVVLANGALCGAQTIDLDLSMPDVPAFSILNISPTQIERPTTPKALALALVSATADSTNLIPSQYALVVAPYWLGHRSVLFGEYLNPGVKQSVLQTFTASFASSRVSASGSTRASTDVSVGFAAALHAGHAGTTFDKSLSRLHTRNARMLAVFQLEKDVTDVFKLKRPDPIGHASPSATPDARSSLEMFLDNPTPDALKSFLGLRVAEAFTGVIAGGAAAMTSSQKGELAGAVDALGSLVDDLYAADPLPALVGPVGDLLTHVPPAPGDAASLREIRRLIAFRALSQLMPAIRDYSTVSEGAVKAAVAAVQSEDTLRVGWMLSVSGAIGARVPDDRFADARQLRWALWASPTYRSDGTHVDLIGIAKWTQRPAAEGPNLFDAGVRFVKQAGSASFSAEYVQRTEGASAVSSASTERATVNFDYKVAERLFVTAAFGKDFADPSVGKAKGGLVSILGVSLGLSKSPSVQTP